MSKPTEKSFSVLRERLSKFAVELAMIEVGKDAGLLVVFSDVIELGKLVNEPGVPDAIRDGALPPRKWLDDILDTTAVFDTLAITRLSEWFGWFESALDCWQQERPLPEIPAHLLTSAGENIPPIEAVPAPLV